MNRILYIAIFLVNLFANNCFAQSSDDAKYEQARMFYNSKEYTKALPILKELANKNHAKSYNVLGLCYEHGYGVSADIEKAFDYYLKGAELGYCYAQRNLAWLFQTEKYMELHPDIDHYKKAEQWLRLAAKQSPDIMYELACFYDAMQVMNEWQDKDANIYYIKAAESGNAKAQARIGFIWLTEQKFNDALSVLNKAKSGGVKYISISEVDDNKEAIDVLIMLCTFFKKNGNLAYKGHQTLNNKVYVNAVKSNAKEGCLLLSLTGKIIAQTPFVYNYIYYNVDEDYFEVKIEDSTGNMQYKKIDITGKDITKK